MSSNLERMTRQLATAPVAPQRIVSTLTLFLPGPPLTRCEPLIGRRGPYPHPLTTKGMWQWQEVWAREGRLFVQGPVVVEVYVRCKRPASYMGKNGLLNTEGKKYPVPSKFDLSNVIKLVEDALKQHAFGDDSAITALHARKSWSTKPAGTEVSISHSV